MQGMVKVRFAPSPTGILHVGGIRTALFNYFFAKANNGIFVLRNEDTDQARKVEGSLEATLDSLKWLGVTWDDLVTQSERLSNYKKYADELVAKGQAKEEDGAIRFLTPNTGTTEWQDLIGNKKITFENSEIEDFIILKKDGFPTYHLANVIDDHLMEITHVIRGEDWIPSAPKHIMLYKAFGWNLPFFAHVPNVLGEDRKKLSKRRGAKSVLDFKNEGYLPEALLNYLMLLGWSPKNDQEILSKEEIEKQFNLENVHSGPAIFNHIKLDWINGEYIRSFSDEKLFERILEFDSSISEYDLKIVKKLIVPAKTRMKTLSDFKKLVAPFLNPRDIEDDLRKSFSEFLSQIDEWNLDNLIERLKIFVKENDINFKKLYKITIDETNGLPLADVFEILGKEKVISLLNPQINA